MRGTFGKNRVNKWESLVNRKKEGEQPASTQKTFDEDALYTLTIHQQDSYGGADIAFNPDIFPNIKLHDKLLIRDADENRIIVQVQKESFMTETKNKNFHLSISKQISENYNLNLDISSKMNIRLKILEDTKNFELDTIEINFKDQVLYRRDLYKLEKKLVSTCLYTNKIVSHEGVKGRVMQMISKVGDLVHSGIVTEKTKLVFRTLSSRYYVLIEMSREMCDCNINGELYLEKAIKTIKALLQRMDVLHTHHKHAFILYARLYYPQFNSLEEAYNHVTQLGLDKEQELNKLSINCSTFQVDIRGKVFQDVYHRVNTREIKRDWENIVSKIKETIFTFLRYINWKLDMNQRLKNLINPATVIDTGLLPKLQDNDQPVQEKSLMLEKNSSIPPSSTLEPPNFEDSSPQLLSRSSSQHQIINEISSDDDDPPPKQNSKEFCIPFECELASSEYSNLLESLNLALSMYNHHQLSRTLTTTGHTVAVLTAGEGKYFVDSNLARLTKECMVLGRVYCNLLALREDIPYKEPVFVFQENPRNYYADLTNGETRALLSFENLIQEPQSQMVSTNSMESFATFSISEQIDQKDGFPFFKNYVGISHLKDVDSHQSLSHLSNKVMRKELEEYIKHDNNDREHLSIEFEEAFTKSKKIYWLNLIPGFSAEALNSHSLIFSFPKTNPDPFLSLSSKSVKVYQPSFQIQQLIKDLPNSPSIPRNSIKIAEVDKFLNNLVKPKTSIFQGETNNFSKGVLIHKMNDYDGHIFNENKEVVDVNTYSQEPGPLPVVDYQPDSDRSSERSPDSYGATSLYSSGNKGTVVALSVEKKGSGGSQAHIFRSFADKIETSTIRKSFSESWDEMHLSNKVYSHYRLRWAGIENTRGSSAHLRNNIHLHHKIMKISPNIFEFESVWKDLSIPPMLPLQTYFFPSEQELLDDKKYQKLQYYFNLTGDIKQKIDDFMDELISQRLTLDFQLVEGEALDSFGKSSNVANNVHHQNRLSWGTQHHKISLNLNNNLMCNIFTKKKERKVGNSKFNVNFFPTYYRYLLFNDRGKGLVRKSIIFDGLKQINWNKFDLYISNCMKDDQFERSELANYRVKVISLIMLPIRVNGALPKYQDLIQNYAKVMTALQEKLSEYGFRGSLGYSIIFKRKELKKMLKESDETTRIVKVFIGGQASGFNHFYFEYNKYYCPKAAFHFNLHWFSCPGSTVTDLIRSMSSILRNANFSLKFIPERYKILHAHPFESNLRINCKSEKVVRSLRKAIRGPPFNFILDTYLNFTSFVHDTGSIILYFFDTFIVWKDNRLVDTNITSTADSDITILCEKLFRNLLAFIHSLEILHDLVDKVQLKS